MRFRARDVGSSPSSKIQIGLCVAWTALTAFDLHRDISRHDRSATIFHGVCLLVFAAAFLVHLYSVLFTTVTLKHDALILRQGFYPKTIPYANVVDAQPAATPKVKQLPHVVELEIARIAREVYPHEYRRLHLDNPSAFLEALRPHLAQRSTPPAPLQ